MPDRTNVILDRLMLAAPTVLSLLLAGWVALLRPPALESQRPQESSVEPESKGDIQPVSARLWQDPLTPAYADWARRREKKVKADFEDFSKVLNTQLDLPEFLSREGLEIPVLIVFLRGVRYAEDIEQSRRHRYAVHAALSVAGYTPRQSDRIGYVVWHPPKESGREVIVPFEWIEKRPAGGGSSAGPDLALLAWLDETALGDKPWHTLWGLLTCTRQEKPAKQKKPEGFGSPEKQEPLPRWSQQPLGVPSKAKAAAPELPERYLLSTRITLIGPTNSTLLRKICEEARAAKGPGAVGQSGGTGEIQIGSTQATAPMASAWLSELLGSPVPPESPGAVVSRVINTIGSDGALAQALVEELEARGISPDPRRKLLPWHGGDHVALITEFDTVYGREMIDTFRRAFLGVPELAPLPNPEVAPWLFEGDRQRRRVHSFTYLRGLDGKVAQSAPPGAGQPSPPPGVPAGPPRSDPSVALAQTDYLRRLVQSMKQTDVNLRAIGVLGSDVYDKILLIKALRHEFPAAVLFTTDLDHRLLYPSEPGLTRNLLIASHYNLRLRDWCQRSIPPFRDSYQTSLFAGCLAALDEKVARDVSWESEAAAARLFEVGRNGAYELTLGSEASVHPPSPRSSPWLFRHNRWLFLAAALAAIAAFALPLRAGRRRRADPAEPWWHRVSGMEWLACLGCLLLAVFGLIVLYDHVWNPQGEPFSLFEGISTWPGEFLRLVGCLLATAFVVQLTKRRQENDHRLKLDYCAPQAGAERGKVPRRTFGSWLGNFLGELSKAIVHPRRWFADYGITTWRNPAQAQAEPEQAIPFDDLWDEYWKRGSSFRAFVRVFFQGGAYFLFVIALVCAFGVPTCPARGSMAFTVHYLFSLGAILSLILLIFYVLDATWLASRFSRLISGENVEWDPAVYQREWDRLAPKTGRRALGQEDRRKWLRHLFYVRVIGDRTQLIGGYIFAPFVVLLILVLARYAVFDNWDFPLQLLVAYGLHVVLLVAGSVVLRATARGAKLDALRFLRAESGRYLPRTAERVFLESLIGEVESIQEGALSSLLRNPVIGAVLIPVAGIGLLTVLELLRAPAR